jgi:hypothetical protein
MKRELLYVLCFGNPLVAGDSGARKLAKSLKMPGVEFVECDSPQSVLDYAGQRFMILDVAKGVRKPTLIEGTESLQANKLVSLHDYDLGFFLKLMERMGKGPRARIIAIPEGYSREEAGRELEAVLRSVY